MLVFVIPVKSEIVSSDWEQFSLLFERCIKSVCQQTAPDFRVVVACHEIPKIAYANEKVEFLQVPFDAPLLEKGKNHENYLKKERDKGLKVLEGVKRATEMGASYVMVVDSDDCISNKICDFVTKQDPSAPGWFLKKGYIYQEGRKIAFLNNNGFYTLCGSSIIIKPEFIKHMYRGEYHFDHSIIQLTPQTHLQPLPFPGAIYSMANGENHYMSSTMVTTHNKHQFKFLSQDYFKSLFRKLMKYRPKVISTSMSKEFGMSLN